MQQPGVKMASCQLEELTDFEERNEDGNKGLLEYSNDNSPKTCLTKP